MEENSEQHQNQPGESLPAQDARQTDKASSGWAGWNGTGDRGSWGGWYAAGEPAQAPSDDAAAASAPALPAPRPKHRYRVVVGSVAAAVIAAGAAGGGVGYALASASTNNTPIPARADSNGIPAGLTGEGLNVAAIAASTEPGIVDVVSTVTDQVSGGNFFFGGGTEQGVQEGTGMILTSSGEVLTNNHVVENATGIKVSIAGHSASYTAKVIGTDPTADIALLQIQGVSGLHSVSLDLAPAAVGQPVVAIGNALGLGGTPTVTAGIVSAVNRSITAGGEFTATENLSGLVQTDAPIEPGNSGGPLLNADGKVIGMTTAAAVNEDGSNESASNMGFAISAGQLAKIVSQITSDKASSQIVRGQTAFLGVSVLSMSSALAAEEGLSIDTGALVQGVVPGTAAARAGLAVGDDIVAVGGTPVSSSTSLRSVLSHYGPGESTRVTWVSQTGQHAADVVLGIAPVA